MFTSDRITSNNYRDITGNLEGNRKHWTFNKFTLLNKVKRLKEMEERYWFPRSLIQQFRLQLDHKFQIYPDNFEDLRNITLDIETQGLDSNRHEITLISTKCEGDVRVFVGAESTILRQFKDYIMSEDFDVLIGHNILSFDIPFIESRARINNMVIHWSDKMSMVKENKYQSKFTYRFGDFYYTDIEINGVEIIDTMFMVMAYDVIKRDMPNYKLKVLEEYFDLARPNRLVLTPEQIVAYGKSNRKKLIEYCVDDIEGTEKLYRKFAPAYYYQLREFPISYQNSILWTTVPKWDSAILIEYIRANHSIPLADGQGDGFRGGDVQCFETGLLKNVHKVDVSSLYPSIIRKFEVKSPLDILDIGYNKLCNVFDKRIEFKKKAYTDPSYTPLEQSLKYVINPYFGYLSNGWSMFNYVEGGKFICEKGREYINQILDITRREGGTPIELDTDGLLYQGASNLYEIINDEVDEGIDVDYEGSWEKMICYKKKNYVLKNPYEKIKFKGVFFKNSKHYPLKQNFLNEIVDCFLDEKCILPVLQKYYTKIQLGNVTPEEIMERYNAKNNKADYLEKQNGKNNHPLLPYEYMIKNNIPIKIGESIMLYQRNDGGKKYECAGAIDRWDGKFAKGYYMKAIFKKIEDIFKNCPSLLKEEFREGVLGYEYWRYKFTGVKSKKLRELIKKGELTIDI